MTSCAKPPPSPVPLPPTPLRLRPLAPPRAHTAAAREKQPPLVGRGRPSRAAVEHAPRRADGCTAARAPRAPCRPRACRLRSQPLPRGHPLLTVRVATCAE